MHSFTLRSAMVKHSAIDEYRIRGRAHGEYGVSARGVSAQEGRFSGYYSSHTTESHSTLVGGVLEEREKDGVM